MKNSLFLKLFLRYFLVTLALTASIIAFYFVTIKRLYISALTENLQNIGVTFTPRILPLLDAPDRGRLNGLVRDLDRDIRRRITVILPDGSVVADSEHDFRTMDNHRMRPEIAQALEGTAGTALRFSDTVREEMLYVAIPMTDDGTFRGVLRISVFLRDINALLDDLKKHSIPIVLVLFALSLAGAFFFSRQLLIPVKQLILAAKKVALGDLNAKVIVTNSDELSDLASSFNDMTGQLSRLFYELDRQKRELNAIISSIQEGLLVIDREGRVTLNNFSMKKMLGTSEIGGRFYWEVIREPRFEELLSRVRDERVNRAEELELNGRRYLCSITVLPYKEAFVALFHDITQISELERMKKDFVVNVSHELRTPLTAIRGFVETLEDEVSPDGYGYLDIIRRHTYRLINIVEDLLLLSELEEKGYRLEPAQVDLCELVRNTARMFDQKLADKGLSLGLELPAEPVTAAADPFKMEQVLINLIDNAIKYTEKGGVTVALSATDRSAVIEVRDTGIGILPEHLPRLFERFYVVDKSRSKKVGGTGLGLSIVKHIVLLHNGTIDADSTVGEGTRFTVMIPRSL